MTKIRTFSLSPLVAAVVTGIAVPALVLGLGALGLLSRPGLEQPRLPQQLLLHPTIMVLSGIATGVAVWLGLFAARCKRLSTARTLLVPTALVPVLVILTIIWSLYVQAFSEAARPGSSIAFDNLGLLWALVSSAAMVTAYFIGRPSGTRASGA